ncbi:pyruvate formate-lyase-activating protein [Segnochrobactraceae bacterium EtOH-i3]
MPDSHCPPHAPDHAHDGETGYLHSVETGAAADGPGMRFVFFLAGCPFRCLYCHNPDTWRFTSGRPVTLEEALAEVRPYAGMLRRIGGVTVSGGEPLTQPAFAGRLLTALHDGLGLHTALDTQGFLGHKVDDAFLEKVDLVLLDVKHSDSDRHKALTGRPLERTLEFARRLVALGKPLWIRHVVIPGWTDDDAHLARLADLLAGLGPLVERVDLLPYHRMGEFKWAELGRPFPLPDTPPADPAQMAHAIDILRSRGLPAV